MLVTTFQMLNNSAFAVIEPSKKRHTWTQFNPFILFLVAGEGNNCSAAGHDFLRPILSNPAKEQGLEVSVS